MKNYPYLLLACLLINVIISGCNGSKTPKIDNTEYSKVSVNPEHITNPPIPESVNITALDEPSHAGNMLYEATFSKEKVKGQMLAVMITDSDKIVLHDDGKNGDKVADDGVFSLVFNEDGAHVKAYLAAKTENFSRSKRTGASLTRFKGRFASAVALNDCTLTFLKSGIDFQKGISLVDFAHLPLFIPVTETLKHNSLMITNPLVVNDPNRTFRPCSPVAGTPGGAWTFGHLITEMANQPLTGVAPETFLMNFLQTWLTTHTVNGDVIDGRSGINNIINDWITLSGGAGSLDVNKAPFKLLAIVNRFDLRTSTGYGGGTAGEGRFVFCATTETCVPIRFLVIFEYGVNITKCPAIHDYAQQWANLETIPIGTSSYNTALQAITDQFVLRNTNSSKPNGSSLNQIRTNELALGASPWQLREFNINSTTHLLENVTTKREPQIAFNSQGSGPDPSKVEALGKFVNDNELDAIADKLNIPLTLSVGGSDVNFLGAKANTENASTFHWDAQVGPPGTGFITSDAARMHISLNTCSGCHGGETFTGNFMHVGLPVTASGATLSRFLTGEPPFTNSDFLVDDRAHRPDGVSPPADIQWPFNDLERRGRDLMDFLDLPCPPKKFPFDKVDVKDFRKIPPVSIVLTHILTFDPLTMTH